MMYKELFPKSEEIFSWIKDLTQWGHRKTGTPEGRKSAEYIAEKMKSFGLEDVVIEKTPSMCMFVDQYELSIDDENLETFFINGTNRAGEQGLFSIGSDDQLQRFVYLDKGLKEDFEKVDVKGKIVVCSIDFPDGSPLKTLTWNDTIELYDPEEKISKGNVNKPDIYSPNNWPYNYFYASFAGAAGFIGILEDYYDDPYFYNEDYTEIGQGMGLEYMSIPGMWVSRTAGISLKEKFDKNEELTGLMKMVSRYEYRDALNVSGRLPGNSEDIILVHSHHDAVFDGAVQDASGISEMLAIAKYFSQVLPEERQRTMMFAATDTHYTDYMGHQGFIAARKAAGDNIVLDIAIEHIGKEVSFNENKEPYLTGEVESRMVYITEGSGMYDVVKEKFMKYGLDKVLFYPVKQKNVAEGEVYEFNQDEIISDAYYFFENDIQVVSMVCGEAYLFHPTDQIDKIPVEQLVPVGMAFTEIALAAAEKI